jgi:rhodanese-related sulfurtransferase
MNLISRDELRAKLHRGDPFALVMTLPELAYRAKRIPTSLLFETGAATLDALDPDQEIVVYCADVSCAASIYAYHLLDRAGYKRVRRYAGGIADWEAAGYPFEQGAPVARDRRPGERVTPPAATRRSHVTPRRSRPCSPAW